MKANLKSISLYIMAALYVLAGINHFWHPLTYQKIMPSWLPFHTALIYGSGILEILLAILLVPFFTRRWAAWGILILLIAVFPANVQMLINYVRENNPYTWVAVVRLPLQFVLIWWTYSFTKPVDTK